MSKDTWHIPIYQRRSDPEPIKFPNYRINMYGQVRSLRKNKILRPVKISSAGYYEIGLTNEFATKDLYSSQIKCLVHKLVAHTFIPNKNFDKYCQVNHIDGNRLHNHIDNLEWVTGKQNVQHAVTTGLAQHPTGFAARRARLTPDLLSEIKGMLGSGVKQSEIAYRTGISQSTISQVKHRARDWY